MIESIFLDDFWKLWVLVMQTSSPRGGYGFWGSLFEVSLVTCTDSCLGVVAIDL